MIKINKLASLFLYLLLPMIGFLLSLLSIRRRNNFLYLNSFYISIFIFIIFIYIPPLGDLYRHYQLFEHIDFNNPKIYKLDFLFYFNLIIFKNLCIPFFILPALYTSISVYLYLKSFEILYNNYSKNHVKITTLIIYVLIILLNISLFTTASGLRFGLSTALVIFAYSLIISKNKNLVPLIILLFASFMHFSSYLFIIIYFFSKIKLNKLTFIALSSIAIIMSQIIVFLFEYLVQILNYGHSYVLGKWADSSGKNIAGQIKIILNQLPFFLFLFLFIINKNKFKNINIIYWAVIIALLTKFSFTLFLRFSVVPTFIMLYMLLIAYKEKLIIYIILLFSIIYFLSDSIYGYRRQILLGNMWEALYKPPILKMINIDKDYDFMLNQINKDGLWINNPVES
uniref:Wzy n=1 Tax=Proteus vulgaris TaxID=585 RepID=A0A385JMV8_PROVU|nr:wzy [Proteus vulgaris]